MRLTTAETQKIALLARLTLSNDELSSIPGQLSQIVEYFNLLSELDTDDVAPMAHVGDLVNVFRDDNPQQSLPRKIALGNAPHRTEECYLVPAVFGDTG